MAQVLLLTGVVFRRPRPLHDRRGHHLVAGPPRYLRRQVQRRGTLPARAESGDDGHRADASVGTRDTTCVTGILYSARARSTTSKRCHTESSGGSVEITI